VHLCSGGAHHRLQPAEGIRRANRGSGVIAIVDAYDAPNAFSDLTVFSQNFGLPLPSAENFQVVYATSLGTSTSTPPAYNSGWESEVALDIQDHIGGGRVG
jgi:subtilase family serine protease